LEVQAPQHGKRQDKDGHVRDDVPCSVDVPEGEIGYAGARYRRVPEFVDWIAVEDDDEKLRQCPATDEYACHDDDLLHLPHPEYSIVLQEEGELDRHQGGIV
jgi:hypothetical protein